MKVSTRKLTSFIDLARVAIRTQSLISLDLFHTALAITFATLPFILLRESNPSVVPQNCSYVYGSSSATKNLDWSAGDISLTLLLVANTDVLLWADLVFPYFVSQIIRVSIKFSSKA
jgi:hypothetical protein